MSRIAEPKTRQARRPVRSKSPVAPSDGIRSPSLRMTSQERERSIVDAAVTFFTEHGFEGQTRELAATLGITQPLLYRYFSSKEALIDRVYEEVFVGRWNPRWEELIADRKRPISERLTAFYRSYAKAILTPEWIRLFMFSGLRGLDLNTRYLRVLRERIFVPVISELRHHFDRPPVDERPITEIEVEMIWALHASIFYIGVREFIYRMPVAIDVDSIIEAKIITLLDGVQFALPAKP